ncbi:MAG TPA: site-2 protease family protein, partial [Gemmatimonadales bacterium]|nr:site-2 protease family protein [Gemmatimonadales bacterium]
MTRLPSRNARSPGVAVFGRRYHLATVFGFDIGIDASWLLIVVLITWSLAVGWFPAQAPGFSTLTYWIMGVLGALGLFAAVVAHELSHALVARREGVEMRGITLFIFGGVAHMGGEPESPGAEVRVALAGPLASVV